MNNNREQKKLQKWLFFPGDVEREVLTFKAEPVRAIGKFLECFDPNGVQAYEFPPHVLDFLHERFQVFMQEKQNTIDKAFGGSTARQRKKVKLEESDHEIHFDVLAERDEINDIPDSRERGTTYGTAIDRVAKNRGKSDHAIHDVLKRNKKR